MRKFYIWCGIVVIIYAALFLRHYPKFDQNSSTFATICNGANTNLGSKFSIVDSYPGSYVDKIGAGYAYKTPEEDVAAKLICQDFPSRIDNPLARASALAPTDFEVLRSQAPNYTIEVLNRNSVPSVASYLTETFILLAILGFMFLFKMVGKK